MTVEGAGANSSLLAAGSQNQSNSQGANLVQTKLSVLDGELLSNSAAKSNRSNNNNHNEPPPPLNQVSLSFRHAQNGWPSCPLLDHCKEPAVLTIGWLFG